MARRVVLHVGLMKSGTTYLQDRMGRNAAVLREHGVLFPVPWHLQVQGVSELVGRARVNVDVEGAWSRLVTSVHEWSGEAVISMEFLGPARPATIEAVAQTFAGATVQVVLTVRDLGRGVPAMWQERVKNGWPESWEDFQRDLRVRGTPVFRSFWRHQGAGRIAQAWAAVFGAEAVTVVTVPPSGNDPGLLWDRFARAAGLPEHGCPVEGERANESLGAQSVELMRELNAGLDVEGLGWRAYELGFRSFVARGLLPAYAAHEQRVGYVPPDWLHERSGRLRALIERTGVRVVGDLDELVPCEVPGRDPAEIGLAERHEVALWALRELGLREARSAR